MGTTSANRVASTMTAGNAKPLSGTQRPAFAIRAIGKLWRLLVDRPYRNLMWLYLVRPKGAFQPFNDTKANRYPRIFGFVQSQFGAESEVKILSYGCATGEEVFSLRNYFSHAVIKGIDINPGNIAACHRRLRKTRDTAISFETAGSTNAEAGEAYDAIFAMAVLRHGGLGVAGVTRCDHLIRFEDFARTVEDFKRCLRPGGLLIIRFSNFRLCDTPATAGFETILRMPLPTAAQNTPIFGPDNRLMAGVDYPDTVFRKK